MSKISFGSYELTAVDVIIASLLFVIGYRLIVRRRSLTEKPTKYEVDPIEMQDFTWDELNEFKSQNNRYFVVIKSNIFDLTNSKKLYESNKSIFENIDKITNSDDWERLFKRKYPFIGKIVQDSKEKNDYKGRIGNLTWNQI